MDRNEIKERIKILHSMVEDYLDLLDMEEAEESETVKAEDKEKEAEED